MIENSLLATIPTERLTQVLGTEIALADLSEIQVQTELLTIIPGTSFWQSRDSRSGIYIILAGKVRLFDLQGERIATLTVGKSFGASTLFPDADFSSYLAKAALVVGGIEILVGFIPQAVIEAWWGRYPAIRTHLSERAQHLDAILRGELEPSALHSPKRGLHPQPPLANRQIRPLAPTVVTSQAPDPSEGGDPAAPPGNHRFKQAYFPTPSQKMGQWWRKVTHAYPFYAQHSAADCSAACVVMVGRYWGRDFNINRLRELAYVNRDGASLKGLANAVENLGFNSRPVKASLDRLATQQLPAILHWEGNHYVVVFEINPQYIIIGDPAIGQRKLTYPEFNEGWTGFCLLMEPTLALQKTEGKSTDLWQLFQLVIPHRTTVIEIFVASIVLQIFGLISPIFTQLILDRAIVHKSESSLAAFGVGLLIFGGFQIAMSGLRQYLMAQTANRIDAALIIGFIRHVFSLPLSYFDSRHVGDIISRIQENHKIQSFITGQSLGVLLDLMSVFVYATLMFIYSWKLALVTLISIPPFLILTFASTPFLKKMSREIFNATNDENSYLIEALNGVRTVKSMSVEKSVRWSWEERLNREIKQTYRGQIMGIQIQMISSTINTISSTALIWLGASLVISGEFTIGQLFAFNMLSANVISPFQRLAVLWNKIQEVGIAIERLCDVIEAKPEEDRDSHRQDIGKLKGYVKFKNVTFRYNKNADTNILENINFEIKPGQTIALVGRSGSGKTTLSKLILGLYQPINGSIEIDGKDLTSISLHSLRSQVGVVDQDTFLFSGTVKENITLAKPGASQQEIERAAELAGADEFIRKMPMRYDTEIGEGGGMLSGGQRQRIAIARALLNNPRLLIFDEATSSLDTESEQIIQNNLEKIRRDRSTVIIAHRLSTVRNADLILVLDKGVLIESGNHQQLMDKRGQYYHLNHQQLVTIQE
ncbi:ABC transporter transmembrane domain-containing protein [Chamaesiphon sp. VAR_48_metabat_403]|uniref:ABC transporter transmembrane domain-containing protein n=1 Tax=Chamaesiphon sp. VAR_48_metabat_403 TaxID=2964700 RepID=UPI00286E7B02|nr:ABC transporter transmembrane domain-containing protein [Chamaesiphon sp. VAR_48_metabat_403]